MEVAAKKRNMKIACEIFADRNYEDDGNLISRSKPNALITNPEIAKKHVLAIKQKMKFEGPRPKHLFLCSGIERAKVTLDPLITAFP